MIFFRIFFSIYFFRETEIFQFWVKNRKFCNFHISYSSSHVKGVCSILLSVSEKDSNYYVNNGVDTMDIVKAVG